MCGFVFPVPWRAQAAKGRIEVKNEAGRKRICFLFTSNTQRPSVCEKSPALVRDIFGLARPPVLNSPITRINIGSPSPHGVGFLQGNKWGWGGGVLLIQSVSHCFRWGIQAKEAWAELLLQPPPIGVETNEGCMFGGDGMSQGLSM